MARENSILRPNNCELGQGYFDGCNFCSCLTNGDPDLCTGSLCKRPADCQPGQSYFTGIEWCFCTYNGPSGDFCTKLP